MEISESLKSWEYVCPDCGGRGNFPVWFDDQTASIKQCRTCLGDGKLDWIEMIVGKYYNFEDELMRSPMFFGNTKPPQPKSGDIVNENGNIKVYNGNKWLILKGV